MQKRFSVKSKYFSLYKAFREEAEKVGWVYNSEFNPFEESKVDSCGCMFFFTEWHHKGWDPKFAFSNHSGLVFELPQQWDEAIEYMTKLFKSGTQKEKLTISLKELAAHHGVSVDDILITQ
jgi:hypothetical protein